MKPPKRPFDSDKCPIAMPMPDKTAETVIQAHTITWVPPSVVPLPSQLKMTASFRMNYSKKQQNK